MARLCDRNLFEPNKISHYYEGNIFTSSFEEFREGVIANISKYRFKDLTVEKIDYVLEPETYTQLVDTLNESSNELMPVLSLTKKLLRESILNLIRKK